MRQGRKAAGLADFDALVARAQALNLKVIIDQVWSHTAIEHPWFAESRSSRDNAKADWYVWADAKPDGAPPSNWQSWMGCATWTWDSQRRQYYLHNFLPQMPDLSFHSAAMQQHLHNVCQPETVLFHERVRAMLDSCDARMAVAEIGSQHSLERMIEYTRGSDRLHTAYSFLLLGAQPTPQQLADMMVPWQQGLGATAWPSCALSNHDATRVATRWALGDAARAQQFIALLACLRGTVFLYQGEELGLPQSEVNFEDLQDPFGRAHWPREKGRDGCRTPMPWQAGDRTGGFTSG